MSRNPPTTTPPALSLSLSLSLCVYLFLTPLLHPSHMCGYQVGKHVNINRLEVMPERQGFGAFTFDRS